MKPLKMVGWSRQLKKWLPVSVYNQSYEHVFKKDVEMWLPTMLTVQLANGEYVMFDTNYNGIPIKIYTGINDISGKEIYSDDLVKLGSTIYRVFWSNNLNYDSGGATHSGFYIKPVSYKNHMYDDDELEYHTHLNEMLIIGDVYRNPDLLNEKAT